MVKQDYHIDRLGSRGALADVLVPTLLTYYGHTIECQQVGYLPDNSII